MISAILAVTHNGGIGNRGTLPWPKHKEDLAWFRQHTENQIVVMGRKTWADPKMPKPLPNRVNVVVARAPIDNTFVRWIDSSKDIREQIAQIAEAFPDKEVFVIGGKQLFDECADIVDRVYLTRMKGSYFTDTRVDLNKMLIGFRPRTMKPGENCTYEIWHRHFSFKVT